MASRCKRSSRPRRVLQCPANMNANIRWLNAELPSLLASFADRRVVLVNMSTEISRRGLCGNFDIILWPFLPHFSALMPPHTCKVLYQVHESARADRMLTGACNSMF